MITLKHTCINKLYICAKIIITTVLLSLQLCGFAISNQLQFVHYSLEDGLASTYVKGITQDRYGFIWIATRENVSRFDGDRFVEFETYNQNGNPIKLLPNSIYYFGDSLLLCESMDNYFYYFDFYNDCFLPFLPLYTPIKKNELTTLNKNEIAFIQGNELCKLNLITRKIVISDLFNNFIPTSLGQAYYSINSNKTILATTTKNGLVLYYNKITGQKKQYKLPDNFINDESTIKLIDNNNNIWVSFYNKGILCLADDFNNQKYFSTNTRQPILHNIVHCVTIDNNNRAWIGNENGLSIYNFKTDEIINYQYNKLYPQGLNTNPVYNAFKDRNGNIWLGTYFAGINLWNSNEPYFKHYTAGSSPYHLVGNVVSSFAQDNNGNLWIGTEDMGICKLSLANGTIDNNNINLSYNNVHAIKFVDNHNLWVATYSGGINIYNTITKKNQVINQLTHPQLPSNFIYSFATAGDTVFIGAINGIATYNLKTKKMSPFFANEFLGQEVVSFVINKNTLWIASYTNLYSYNFINKELTKHGKHFEKAIINQVACDSKNQIWLATNSMGLVKYNYFNGSFTYFNQSSGFPANRIFAFTEGNNNTIWVSCNKGLINFNENSNQYYIYDNNSGLPYNQFNFRAAFKDNNGSLYFGGNNGMVSFNEHKTINYDSIDVVFTDFLLFNKKIAPGNKSPINVSINNAQQINLQHKQNVFTLNFTAFNYTQKGKNTYAYMLEGFDNDFNYVGNRGNATYTNLNPGKYTFKVKASKDSWRTQSAEKKISIIIHPPFFKTKWAYIIYFLVLAVIIYLFYYIVFSIHNSKVQVEIERREKLHIEEINAAKLEFFTNISHEIKTPLTLILGPLANLANDQALSLKTKKSIQTVYRNVKRLNTLLTELLEFRKIERGAVSLTVDHVTDLSFLSDIELAFIDLANDKNTNFIIDYPKSNTNLWFNKSMCEKIIYNLLSNAFKYGATGNYIECKLEIIEQNTNNNSNTAYLKITVTDNGPGISNNHLQKIFDRFYQINTNNSISQGVGIGLAYVKSLVTLHRGTINISSQINQGSVFTVTLPASKNLFEQNEIKNNNTFCQTLTNDYSDIYTNENIENEPDITDQFSNKPVVVIADDNIELLNFMSEILNKQFIVHLAKNGAEALDIINNTNPDIVISDVMMPVMDGLELTSKIKDNIKTSHIPVVLLTAKGGNENCLQGLKFGADLYIEKPFFPPVLEQNIMNIINTRANLKKLFNTDPSVTTSQITHSQRDKEFMNKLTDVIYNNIDNTELDVTFIVQQLNISRSLLHLKLKNLVNCSTTEFVRNIRMRKAVELITNEKCSHAEAAYRTGFASPAYFSRSFKEIYGKSPREFFNNK